MNVQFVDSRLIFKKAILSAGVALALGMTAVSAQAAPAGIPLGTVFASGVSMEVEMPSLGTTFSDVFNFTLGEGSGASIGINSFFLGAMAPTLQFTLQKDGFAAFPTINATPDSSDAPTVSYGAVFNGLTQGSLYRLTVSGTSTDFAGPYTVQISAVPEPESYALLLAGLGLMGTIVRRRKSI